MTTLKERYRLAEMELEEVEESINEAAEEAIFSSYFDEVRGCEVDTDQSLLVVYTLHGYVPTASQLLQIRSETGFDRIFFSCTESRLRGRLVLDGGARVVLE